VPIEAAGEIAIGGPRLDVLALDEALERLAQLDAAKARVVEVRFFGGLSVEETAEALGKSVRTVERDWRFARAWLHRELENPESGS
jgi:RNA polymerase sigma factor (sigma-70 family)